MDNKLPIVLPELRTSEIEECHPTAKWPGFPGECVFRIVVPLETVDCIKERSGETKARIAIFNAFPRADTIAVMVSATEETDSPCPPALDGLLKIHSCILDSSNSTSTKMLVTPEQAESLIANKILKSIEHECSCSVALHEAGKLPFYVVPGDHILEIVGQDADAHKAIELMASHLRRFLVHWSVIPYLEVQMDYKHPSSTWVSANAATSLASVAKMRMMLPYRESKEYYIGADRLPPPLGFLIQSLGSLMLPLRYADAVIGKDGSTITYVRRLSGARVSVTETKRVLNLMVVKIKGSFYQVDTALKIMQMLVDEAEGVGYLNLSEYLAIGS